MVHFSLRARAPGIHFSSFFTLISTLSVSAAKMRACVCASGGGSRSVSLSHCVLPGRQRILNFPFIYHSRQAGERESECAYTLATFCQTPVYINLAPSYSSLISLIFVLRPCNKPPAHPIRSRVERFSPRKRYTWREWERPTARLCFQWSHNVGKYIKERAQLELLW